MNIANRITFLRIILIPVMAVLFFCGLHFTAAAVFLVAVLTDILDGNLARKYDIVTDFGKFLDPIADKMLNITALLLLVWQADKQSVAALILTICTIIIVAREFTVTGFRIIAATNHVVIAADKWGKLKTILQDIAIIFLMIGNWPFALLSIPMDYILLIVATVLTIASGSNYIIKNIQVFKPQEESHD